MAQFGNIGERVAVVGTLLQTSFYCTFAGQAAINVRGWRVSAVGGAGLTFGQINGLFTAIFPALYKPLLANVATYAGLGIRGYKGQPLGLAAPAYDNGNAGVGTGGALMMPSGACGLIHLGTNTAGRIGRGRTYVPFPSASAATATENPTAGYVTALAALGTQLVTSQVLVSGGDSLTLVPCIVQKVTLNHIDITSFVAKSAWATQRRRSDFGRLNTTPF